MEERPNDLEDRSRPESHGDEGQAPDVPTDVPPRTRRALEGFEANPVHFDADDPAPIVDSRASVVHSAKSSPTARDCRRKSLQDELEPETKASTRAHGTAVLEGDAGL